MQPRPEHARAARREQRPAGSRRAAALLAALLLAAPLAVPLAAQPALPEHLSDAAGPFRVEVRRAARDSLAARLLRTAESVPPSVEGARRAAEGDRVGDFPPPGAWWYATLEGVRLPYAVTGEAVHWYLDLIAAQESGAPPAPGARRMTAGELRYTAEVSPRRSVRVGRKVLRDVHVARLRLVWSSTCGARCAIAFTKERAVVMDRSGGVLAMSGDGPIDLAVRGRGPAPR